MRLSSRLLSILCVASLVLPSVAQAATPRTTTVKALKLSDVLAISQKNKKSTSFEFSMDGTSGKTKVSLDVKGTQKGNPTSMADLAGDMSFSANVRLEDSTTVSAKGRLIIVDGTMYVTLESLDTTNDFIALYADMLKEHLGTWFSVPLDASDFDTNTAKSTENDALLKSLDPYFTVKKETTREGATYVVTVPKAKQRLLMKKFAAKGSTLSSYASTQLDSLGAGGLDMTLTMKTVKDLFDSLAVRIAVSSKTDGVTAKTTITGSAKALKSAPVIKAPSKSTPFSDLSPGTVENEDDATTNTFSDGRDAQRKADVNTILNATYQYAIDHDGRLPPTLAKAGYAQKMICRTNETCEGISLDILTGMYLVKVPADPSLEDDTEESGYMIRVLPSGRISVWAPLAEKDEGISVTR